MSATYQPYYRRIVLGLICYACFSTVSFFVLYLTFDTQKTDAQTINMAGKQRMLSQRIALGVMRKQLHIQDNNFKFDKNRLIHDAGLMRSQHLKLVHQSDTPSRNLSTALNTLYFANFNPLYERVMEYTKHAELIAQVRSKEDLNKIKLDLFSEQEVENLLGQLNDVVNQYEIEANSKLEFTKHLGASIFILHVLALGLFYWTCIRPLRESQPSIKNEI